MKQQSVFSRVIAVNLVAVGCNCQVPECAMRQWFSTGCYAQRSKTTLDITGAIVVAVNLAFAKSQSDGNAPDQMTDIEAAQFGLESLPLNFGTVVVVHCESQKVCTELVHVFLIDKRRHDV